LSVALFSSSSVHLASLAAIICYGITMWYEFEDSVHTQCHVWNLLPSFSSTIGNYTPQRYIWRFLVGVSCVLRLFSVAIFSQNLKRSNRKGAIVQILTSMRVAELMGLFLLTMFASTEIFPAHAFGFCLFFLFSMLNITIISRLMGSGVTGSGKLNTNLAWYPAIYLLTFVGCFIAYIVHNKYCLSGVYSVFGALEVIMISSNIMFWHYSDGVEWSSYTISIE